MLKKITLLALSLLMIAPLFAQKRDNAVIAFYNLENLFAFVLLIVHCALCIVNCLQVAIHILRILGIVHNDEQTG